MFSAPEDEATMQEMKRLMDKVDEMKNQRNHLEQQLREQVLKDDITSTLVTRDPKNFDVSRLLPMFFFSLCFVATIFF